jgi:hypothetical protein
MIAQRHVEDDIVLTRYLDKTRSIFQALEEHNLESGAKGIVKLRNSILATNQTRYLDLLDRWVFAAE